MKKILFILPVIFILASGCSLGNRGEVVPDSDQFAGCSEDIKICPDSSAVGRIGKNCEFAPCPVSMAYKNRQAEIAKGCVYSGGTIATSSCCSIATDFPNTCSATSCNCALKASHEVKSCLCKKDQCFDGKKCVLSSEK